MKRKTNTTKKLYLCDCTIEVRRYMADKDEELKKLHIVRAKDEHEAQHKVLKHYEDKCEDYTVSYRVYSIDITEEIS